MNVFDHSETDALFQFSHISHSTLEHLKNVYSSLAICMCLAAVGSYVYIYLVALLVTVSAVSPLAVLGLLICLAVATLTSLGLFIWFAVTPHNPETERKRLAILEGFAFLAGFSLGPILDSVIAVDPIIIVTAFVGTSVIFICFTLSALCDTHRSHLFLRGTLMSGFSILLLVSLTNVFFGTTLLFEANTYLGPLVMCGFVLFNTQLIIEKAENGDKDYIWHCLTLFLDFISIFRRLLIILSKKEKDKKTVSERILCKIIKSVQMMYGFVHGFYCRQ
ncbi:probable Bax inhibitor 1 [Pundamilia nyererei]|uniref:Transmembrane BAX inhibitor motif-containing protein 6 n=1 Tax=Pundamilia nyererei TaxID=303518 RepID=A0A9Y3SAK3_9CICH|nr:PREDICTED: probable Bax inhibitor 1 [Pundamilia nyererei]